MIEPILSGLTTAHYARTSLVEWIPRGSDVAIMDVPVHRNIGDLFILAATRRLLSELDCRVVYSAGTRDYSRASARRAIGDDTIILGLGGGNFGDLYPKYQSLREQVVEDFVDHPIVVLPQTLHFRSAGALDRAVERFGRHRHLRIAVRDEASVTLAQRLTSRVMLMPDIVELTGPAVAARGVASVGACPTRALLQADGTLVVRRRDGEGRRGTAGPGACDWADLFPGFTLRLAMAAAAMPCLPGHWSTALHEQWASFATSLLVDTVGVMRRATRVVTDRLHAAIVARIAGRPVVLVEDSFGKLGAYYRAWWRDDPAVILYQRPGPGPAGLWW